VGIGEEIQGEMVMKCEEIREVMPDLASGLMTVTPEVNEHLGGCNTCADKFAEFQQTMALLDEWKAPEPSPYFDVRLQARLREEMAKPQAGWLAWFRRPVLAAALTVLMAVGLFVTQRGGIYKQNPNEVAQVDTQAMAADPGTAVGDLQSLDKNHDLYSDFDLLDDMAVQHDVVANP
jgi:predicted anti-sigma-YlaC factor YlaD